MGVERLVDAAPPLADDLPSPLHEELRVLESLDDEALWKIAQSQLSPVRQRLYDRLLRKNSQGTITAREKEKLHTLGEEARRLTLKKAHAYILLKWRGHQVPSLEELQGSVGIPLKRICRFATAARLTQAITARINLPKGGHRLPPRTDRA